MLALEQITLKLGDRILLDKVSSIINPGERIGLVGPNGAGKSTLLKIIMNRGNRFRVKVIVKKICSPKYHSFCNVSKIK